MTAEDDAHRRRPADVRGPSPSRPHRACLGPGPRVRYPDPDRPASHAQGHRPRRDGPRKSPPARRVPARSASAGASASSRAPRQRPPPTAPTEIPEETAGPYPGDGSNGPDVLNQSGVVRKDITSIVRRELDDGGDRHAADHPVWRPGRRGTACEPYAGAAVYAWHCDQAGRYSMYSQGVENENYLRGVQAAGDDGIVEFTSVFPACYSGRWPHIHFEVYPSLEAATDSANQIATSQIALPKDISERSTRRPATSRASRT